MNKNQTQEEQEIVAEEVVETADESEETAKETTNDPLQIDYKEKYEKLQARIAGDAFKFRQGKKIENSEDEVDSDVQDDKPITNSELQKLLKERDDKLIRQQSTKEALSIASSLTNNEDEANYALALWENVTLPFDTMEEQMKFIVAGMNAERMIAQNSELKRTIKSKDLANKNTATTTRDAQTGTQPKLSADISAVLKAQGYKFDSSTKTYIKKLSNGKTLNNDGKGRTWVS